MSQATPVDPRIVRAKRTLQLGIALLAVVGLILVLILVF
ncbi:MAG: hypothetical protein UY34_C0002G0041 [Parcubacteria group bacterium GW2011_GWA2_48_9]|nr:MAG: hypothetical protein UY34_C0002G0041 [Parcubacteria group bacterium GW2011_GWA2_48_9]